MPIDLAVAGDHRWEMGQLRRWGNGRRQETLPNPSARREKALDWPALVLPGASRGNLGESLPMAKGYHGPNLGFLCGTNDTTEMEKLARQDGRGAGSLTGWQILGEMEARRKEPGAESHSRFVAEPGLNCPQPTISPGSHSCLTSMLLGNPVPSHLVPKGTQ